MLNNHTIYFEQDDRVPITGVTLVFVGAGEQQEDESRAGLARITAKLLFRGTEKYGREELQKQFELLGAEVAAQVTETDFTIRINTLSKNIERVLELVQQCIESPAFSEQEIVLVKKQESSRLSSALQDQESVLRTAHRYIVFDGSRFGKFGSLSALDRITRENIVTYFSSVRSAQILYVSAISNIPEFEIHPLIERIFFKREVNGFTVLPEREFISTNGPEATIFHLENASNDRLMWSHRGISATDERRYALSLILDALGSFEGYLFDQLRNKNGWCYGVYASAIPGSTRLGRIFYYSDPSNETSKHLIPALRDHLTTFSFNPDFQHRLSERPNTYKNRYSYQLDKNYKLNSRIYFDRYGIPILLKEEYYAAIDRVTSEYAQQSIKEIFDLKNLTMVFYGDAPRIKEILQKFDPTIPIKILNPSLLVE